MAKYPFHPNCLLGYAIKDQNILKDADSLSFYENNVQYFLDEQVEKMGKEKIKAKFDWMYNRITLEKAKQIAKSWYEDTIKQLI